MSEPRVIKKYANRRLYDTVASHHITLEGIRQLIVNGEEVQVVDDTNGEDITRSMLLQIIAEQEQGGRPILNTPLLAQIIRFYGHPMQDLMGDYLQRSVDTFLTQQKQFHKQVRDALAATPLAAMEEMTKKNIEAWTSFQQTLFGAGSKKSDDES